MKRTAVLLTLVAVMAFAPSAFACWKCNLAEGCVGLDIGQSGRLNCDFDTSCHTSGTCQGFTSEQPLAATYTVAAVRVVPAETAKAPECEVKALPTPAPQQAENVVLAR